MDEARKLKKRNYLALTTVVVLLAIVSGILTLRQMNIFRTEKWIADPVNRTRIVDDLLTDHELIGMSEAEILVLLGDPDNNTGYFQQENRFVYWMGPERGLMSIDSEWLILDFTGGVVTDCFITTD